MTRAGDGWRWRQSRAPGTNAGVAGPAALIAAWRTPPISWRRTQHALPPYQPNQLGDGGIESTSLRSGCLHNGIHTAKTGGLWRHRITRQAVRRYPSPTAVQRDRLPERTSPPIAPRTMLPIT